MTCRTGQSEHRVGLPEYRVRAFLAGSDSIMMGKRRSGVAALLDDVESEIGRMDTNPSVLRVRPGDSIPETVDADYLLIEDVLNFPEWENAVAEAAKKPVEVIYGLELCHQVPACARVKITPRT
ncbi:MAG: hypothetical protein ACOX8L_00190 [Candidatus Methanomethylophilaceae archaeon]|jgi:hypothetical protein